MTRGLAACAVGLALAGAPTAAAASGPSPDPSPAAASGPAPDPAPRATAPTHAPVAVTKPAAAAPTFTPARHAPARHATFTSPPAHVTAVPRRHRHHHRSAPRRAPTARHPVAARPDVMIASGAPAFAGSSSGGESALALAGALLLALALAGAVVARRAAQGARP